MSHSLMGILVKNPEVVSEEWLARKLRLFDEERDIKPYDTVCWCVGREAEKDISAQADELFGTIDEAREWFYEEGRLLVYAANGYPDPHRDDIDPQIRFDIEAACDVAWRNIVIAPREEFESELRSTHPGMYEPDPWCGLWHGERNDSWPKDAKEGDVIDSDDPGCLGTGVVKSDRPPSVWKVYNLNDIKGPALRDMQAEEKLAEGEIKGLISGVRWDWYAVGGRWRGVWSIEGCMIKVDDILAAADDPVEIIPFSVLTPQGRLFECGRMGWWGIVSDEADNWRDVALAILQQYRGYYILAVDVHI